MLPRQLYLYLLSKALSVKIRLKIMGIAVGLVLLLGVSVIFVVRRNFSSSLVDELVERGTAIASDVAGRGGQAIAANDLLPLYALIGETTENNDDVRYIFILDRARDLLVHTFPGNFPPDLLTMPSAGNHTERSSVEVLDVGNGLVYDVAVPVRGGSAAICHVGMSAARVKSTVDAITQRLIVVTAITSLAGVVAAYLLTALLTKPILELVEVTQAVGQGDFHRRATCWAQDEIGQLSAAFNTMTDSLQRSQDQLRQEERMRSNLLEKVITAQEDERKRVARELHDETSQSLTSLMVGLKTLEMSNSLGEARAHTTALRRLATKTLEEVHALSVGLRPSLLDDLGLVAALERCAADFSRQHSVRVDYQAIGFNGNGRLPPQLEITLYRVAQEALTNAVRHGNPQNISVVVEAVGDTLPSKSRSTISTSP